jgi:pimeloyl-ACP methyl ester carboxylesterase
MRRLSFLTLMVTLLTACGVSPQQQELNPEENPAAYQDFTEQKIAWEPCDPAAIGAGAEEFIGPVKDRLECATIKAPLDWYDPEVGQLDLAILRVKAGNPEQRKGTVFNNPGGPGRDGLLVAVLLGSYAATAQAPVPAAAELQQLSAQYDIVGFSPRGVGGSTQLTCDSTITAPFAEFYTNRSKENVAALQAQGRLAAEVCQTNSLSKYINTDQTARDMNLMRILLGDDKLNYLGVSYGTWLGAWYAKLFPEATGNFVLDSNVDFSARSLSETFNSQPESFQNGFEKIAIPYLVRNNAVFELGDSNEAVYAVYDSLPLEVKAAVTIPIRDSLYGAGQVIDIGVLLVAAKGLAAVFEATASPFNPDTFLKEVEAYRYATIDALDGDARGAALQLSQAVLVELERQPVPIILDAQTATKTSVICNDGETITYPNYWVYLGDRENMLNPLIGGVLTATSCPFWKNPSASVPFMPLQTPVLMVQSEFDPATNTSGARKALYSTPNAKMVFVNDEKQHGVFPHSECVDKAVVQHLLDGTMPNGKVTNCAANPLPGETQVFPADGIVPFGLSAQSAAKSITALLVEDEETLAEKLHEVFQDNAIRP